MDEVPVLLRGGAAVDDRGSVGFINEFAVSDYRRMYIIANHDARFIRAWHGHRFESKAATVLTGAALICAIRVDDWSNPSPDLPVHRFALSERVPGVVMIPPGYANGFMSLAPDTRIAFFSSATLEESLADDIRFPSRYWDPWSVEER